MSSDVFIAECRDYTADSIRSAMAALTAQGGGLDWVRPGMRIGIKLNLCAALPPERAAVTHPALAVELAKQLVARGASVVLGDSPGGPFTAHNMERIYEATGLRKALAGLESSAGEISLNTDLSSSEVTFTDGVSVKSFVYCNWLKNCDEVINFCKLKAHGLMGITGAVKNLYGVIPGLVKSEYHFAHTDPMDFANMLVDLDEYVKPKLCIVDAVDIMEGNGPTKGTVSHLGLMLAGRDPYLLDRVGAALLGVKEDEIPYLIAARQRELLSEDMRTCRVTMVRGGSGSEDCRNTTCDLTLQECVGAYGLRDFERSGATSSWFARTPEDRGIRKLAKQGFYLLMRSKPAVEEGCTGCGWCARNCPAHAIRIVKGQARIDRRLCVRCFCCQEFCPNGAMKVRRSVVARLIDHA